MFTGIIESLGKVTSVHKEGGNTHFTISSSISGQLKIDQSVAHDGVCLTVVDLSDGAHTVTAIEETLDKSTLCDWAVGREVNLERCMKVGDRLDGHWVQGHVDQTGKVAKIENRNGSWLFSIQFEENNHRAVSKGSVTLNGVSLTVIDAGTENLSVAIIPYTFEHTTFHRLKKGDGVNIEFDILGKYIATYLEKQV